MFDKSNLKFFSSECVPGLERIDVNSLVQRTVRSRNAA